ncbi:hypothetical protein BDP55DRAFT_280418 [Colletotrichum godetiae]|uniref:Uncharacterized protein n=1 Tax=Colletotrichum godetiae TaxID=1209918 RepID=A0AAJ0AEP2_9PEZI|nr:uncharacterized protein BDP55DRAFT_280418 [Colletotrichum godetiae]KAK1671930.1 hypothetical protein BDP55DRAFT_280418 [Colletotrichum godetiae]
MGCRVGISEGGAHRRSSPAQLPCRDTETREYFVLRTPSPTYLSFGVQRQTPGADKAQKRERQETRDRNKTREEYPIPPTPGEPARHIKASHLSGLPSYPGVSRLTPHDVTAHAQHLTDKRQATLYFAWEA